MGLRRIVVVGVLLLGMAGCAAHGDRAAAQSSARTAGASAGTSAGSESAGSRAARRVSLRAYFGRHFRGSDLRLGRVRERTAAYTSYAITYRSQSRTISGLIDVPTGPGPFPAVVLAHGYIPASSYVTGQDLDRERAALATAGYVALHVDYRGYGKSSPDPHPARNYRLGYAVDVINAVNALRASTQVPVDDGKVALWGHSMGGGVVLQALEMDPGAVQAAVVDSGVSSNEADNFRRFLGGSVVYQAARKLWGTPSSDPSFYRGVSTRPYLARIRVPVLLNHGTADTTCPPSWARATYAAMKKDGVDAQLHFYQGEGHAFDAKFDEAMRDSLAFVNSALSRP